MSTLTNVNVPAEMAGWARQLGGMFAKDLSALPEGAFTQAHSGKARTPQDFTAETALVNHHVAASLRGEEKAWLEGDAFTEYMNTFADPARAGELLMASANDLADAIESNPESLGNMTKAPWGAEVTQFAMVNLCTGHMMYHDGQLNQLHMLHGDEKNHWF